VALPATDAFTGSNGTALTTYSASWTYNVGTFAINTNALQCTTDGIDCAAHRNDETFGNDQYATATVTAITSGAYIGLSVRCHASDNTFYGFEANSFESYLYKYVGGSYTQLGSTAAAFSVSDVLRLEANGTSVAPTKNGSATGTPGAQTDSAIASGYGGVAGSGNNSGSRIDTWESGDLGGGATLRRYSLSLVGVG
jgi:hypothetical protein